MPKEIPTAEKTGWLRAYEDGDSYALIAERHRRDVRTVKRGVEEARRLRYVRSARSELFKEALTQHQNDLKDVIKAIMAALKVPPLDLVLPLAESTNSERVHLEGATVLIEASGSIAVTLDREGTLLWELLREHLKRDPLWEILSRWKSAVGVDVASRVALKDKAKELLAEKTGLPVLSKTREGGPLCATVTVNLFYRAALSRIFGIPDGPDLEGKTEAGPGEVRYTQGTLLAKVPEGTEERCRQNILEAFNELLASPEVKSVQGNYKQVEELTTKAMRTVEEISLMRMVPGQCRVCRRIGL